MKLLPSIIRALLQEHCTLELEALDHGWASDLLTHLYIPIIDLDVEIRLNEGLINVQSWQNDQVSNCKVFDPYNADFEEKLGKYLIPLCKSREVHMRYPNEENRNNSKTSKTS